MFHISYIGLDVRIGEKTLAFTKSANFTRRANKQVITAAIDVFSRMRKPYYMFRSVLKGNQQLFELQVELLGGFS